MDKIAKMDLIHKLTWPYRKVRELLITLARVLYWLPIIWKDRWWDSSFLLQIIEAKLLYDAKKYKKDGVHVGAEIDAHNMFIAAALCKRLYEQEYTTPWDKERMEGANSLWEYMEAHTEVFGNKGLVAHTSRGYEVPKQLRDASQWAAKREDEMKQQDLDLLCKILQKHLFKWWD